MCIRMVSILVGWMILGSSLVFAETPYQITWSRQLGTSQTEWSHSVAVDASGNAFISGVTWGALGGANQGSADVFLSKYDSSGTPLWTRQLGTAKADYPICSVAVDADGNAFISGETDGALSGTNQGSYDAFVSKYNTSGTRLWTRQWGTSSGDYGDSVAVDASGNAYVSGSTYGSLGGANQGTADAFLSKYNTSGTLLWTQQLGSSDSDHSNSVAVDASGNAFISGVTWGALGGANQGSADVFLSKYNSLGTLLWTRQLGTSSDEVSNSVIVDAVGNALITGHTLGDLGGTNNGREKAFLGKFDVSGTLLWIRQLGIGNATDSESVAVDAVGNIFITGTTMAMVGPDQGNSDVFLSKFNASGTLLWTQQFDSGVNDGGHSVAVDTAGNVLITGGTNGSLGGLNQGGSDAFLIKLSPIPESGSITLLLAGAVSLLGYAWRRRKQMA